MRIFSMPPRARMAMGLTLLLGLGACANTGVVPMDEDTYMVAKQGPQLGFGPPVAAKAEVYRQASAFCAKQGKKVSTLDLRLTDAGWNSAAGASLQFKCVNGAP